MGGMSVLSNRIEGKWIDCFARTFQLCKIEPGDAVAILSETQSRPINVELAELALQRLGARPFHVVLVTPRLESPVPIRSTGASNALQQLGPAIKALATSAVVIDITVEGMLHAVELGEILSGGTRLYMISNEHPEVLERLMPNPALRGKVEAGAALLREAREMRVLSDAGTDLIVDMREAARVGGNWGLADAPGSVSHWPGGLCVCYPRSGSVSGTVVMEAGDVNSTFRRHLERPITLLLESVLLHSIEGPGTDAEQMPRDFAARG